MEINIPFVDLKIQYESIKDEIDSAIKSVISDTAFISGKYAKQFEKDFVQYTGIQHVVSCANGTDSLEILLKTLGVGPGDEVLVPALTWISTSESVSSVGAIPVFVDIDDHFLIDVNLIEEKITPQTKAIIPVHFYGHPAKMKEIMNIAKKHGLVVVEDCAQSHGAQIKGNRIGTFGDAASFSFYPGKNLGAYGDAGAMASQNKEIADFSRRLANHGQEGKHNHLSEGRNSRMDGLHAAILSVKLNYIESWTEKRIALASKYNELLKDTPVETPKVLPEYRHVYHLYVIRAPRRDELKKYLKDQGIDSLLHYPKALPFLPCYQEMKHKPSDFPNAARATEEILSLPMFPELSEDQIQRIAKKIKDFYAN